MSVAHLKQKLMAEVSQVMKKCWVAYMDMYVHVQNINDIYARSFF